MTRPFIHLSDEECDLLIAAGYSRQSVYQWQTRRRRPWKQHYRRICKILKRDVSEQPKEEPLPELPPTPQCTYIVATSPSVTISACDHDELCIPIRRIAHKGTPGTIEDQRRLIVCTNCKRGIERERKAAEKKVRQGYLCECGEPKSHGSYSCRECEHDRRRTV